MHSTLWLCLGGAGGGLALGVLVREGQTRGGPEPVGPGRTHHPGRRRETLRVEGAPVQFGVPTYVPTKRMKREYAGENPDIMVTDIWGEEELFEEELQDEMKNEGYVGEGEHPPELPPEELAKLDIIAQSKVGSTAIPTRDRPQHQVCRDSLHTSCCKCRAHGN